MFAGIQIYPPNDLLKSMHLYHWDALFNSWCLHFIIYAFTTETFIPQSHRAYHHFWLCWQCISWYTNCIWTATKLSFIQTCMQKTYKIERSKWNIMWHTTGSTFILNISPTDSVQYCVKFGMSWHSSVVQTSHKFSLQTAPIISMTSRLLWIVNSRCNFNILLLPFFVCTLQFNSHWTEWC